MTTCEQHVHKLGVLHHPSFCATGGQIVSVECTKSINTTMEMQSLRFGRVSCPPKASCSYSSGTQPCARLPMHPCMLRTRQLRHGRQPIAVTASFDSNWSRTQRQYQQKLQEVQQQQQARYREFQEQQAARMQELRTMYAPKLLCTSWVAPSRLFAFGEVGRAAQAGGAQAGHAGAAAANDGCAQCAARGRH